MEPEIRTKMLKQLSEKLRAKFPATTWLLHGKNCPSRWRFPRSFLTVSKPSRRSITAAKRKEKEKKERRKKIFKIRKAWRRSRSLSRPKTQNLKILISAHARVKMLWNAMPMARRGSCRVANAFSTRANLAEIQPKNHQNVKKPHFWQKSSRSQCVKFCKFQNIDWGQTHCTVQ